MNRLNLNIRGQSVRDRSYLINLVKDARMATCGVLDELTLAANLKAASPDIVVWHRAYGDSDAHKDVEPRDLALRYAREGYGQWDVVAYGPNETSPDREKGITWTTIIDWWCEFAVEAEKLGVRALLGASSSPGNISGAGIDAGEWDKYLRTCSDYADWHYRQDHDYGIHPLWGGTWGGRSALDLLDPAKMQPDNWVTAAEISDDPAHDQNWHLMRGRWLNARAKQLGLSIPPIILAECFWDRMPDLEQIKMPDGSKFDLYRALEAQYGTSGYELLKGHNTWENAYKAWHQYWEFDETLYRILARTDTLYPGEYLGFDLFMWCPLKEDWDTRFGYDMSKRRKLHDFIKAHQSAGGIHPMPTPTTVPKPAGAGEGLRRRLRTNGYINVRSAPSLQGAALANPPRNQALMTVYMGGTVRADNYTWHYVEVEGGHAGWQALVYEHAYEQWVTPEPVARTFRNPAAYPHVILDGGKFDALRVYNGKAAKHEGLDLSSLHSAPEPRLVVAPADGVVEKVVTNDPDYGIFVRIDHGDGYRAYYAHLSKALVLSGQTVNAGEPIGHEGATGNVTGPHLHWTLQHFGHGLKGYVVADVVDPLPLLVAAPEPEPEPEPDDELIALRAEVQRLRIAVADKEAELDRLRAIMTAVADRLEAARGEYHVRVQEAIESLTAPGETV